MQNLYIKLKLMSLTIILTIICFASQTNVKAQLYLADNNQGEHRGWFGMGRGEGNRGEHRGWFGMGRGEGNQGEHRGWFGRGRGEGNQGGRWFGRGH